MCQKITTWWDLNLHRCSSAAEYFWSLLAQRTPSNDDWLPKIDRTYLPERRIITNRAAGAFEFQKLAIQQPQKQSFVVFFLHLWNDLSFMLQSVGLFQAGHEMAFDYISAIDNCSRLVTHRGEDGTDLKTYLFGHRNNTSSGNFLKLTVICQGNESSVTRRSNSSPMGKCHFKGISLKLNQISSSSFSRCLWKCFLT